MVKKFPAGEGGGAERVKKSPSGRGAGEVGRKQKEKLCFPGDLFGVEICNFSLPQRIYDCFMFCIEKNIVLIES